jgi:predicted adenine nucleotide alpha hydrolase (AANH) superfamily ATPase
VTGREKLLLHVCCATCSGGIIEKLLGEGWDLTVFFANPNIHPAEEYEKRKTDVKRFCAKLNVPFIDADYDPDAWFARIKGNENAPERGPRCAACFALRLERTAAYAQANGFPVFATSLGISRWKNLDQVNAAGQAAARLTPDVRFWDCNWRKGGGADFRFEVARREGFYQQTYCGCVFSKNAADARAARKINHDSDAYTNGPLSAPEG